MLEIMVIQLILLIFLLILLYTCLQLLKFLVRQLASYQMPHLKSYSADQQKPVIVGFFHPYCNAGGGGERVLWEAVKALQNRYDHVRCVVYAGDIVDVPRQDVLERVKSRFNIDLRRTDSLSLSFVPLQTLKLVEASTYPRFTLIGQSLGSVFVGLEALFKLVPDVFIDSMGYAFTFPLFKYLADRPVACYVHYPTISSDMLQLVSERRQGHNNSNMISGSFILSSAKLIYYQLFAWSYGWVGRFADVVLVNSSWTRGHIEAIWKPSTCHVVFPPCNVQDFLKLPIPQEPTPVQYITSISQFRPEKRQEMQVRVVGAFLEGLRRDRNVMDVRDQLRLIPLKSKTYKLLLVGSCRDGGDEARVAELRRLVVEMGLQEVVEFRINISFHELTATLQHTAVALHTMWNEHFGIGVVECMAAGTIVLAHDSGGPKADIVVPHEGQKTGFLASDEKSYKETLVDIFCLSEEERMKIRQNGRASVSKFSDSQFDTLFIHHIHPLIAPL